MNSILENKQGLKVLVAAATLQLFMGIVYVWSVFVIPVSEFYNWDPEAVKLTTSYMLCFFGLGIFAGGKLIEKLGASKVVLMGGLLLSSGLFVTAFIPTSTPWLIYITYGIFGGFGVGAAYNANISSAQKWFPKNRGFATGVSVCAFGFSTVIFAPLIEALIRNFGLQQAFLILFAMFITAVLTLFRFVKLPETTGTIDEAMAQLLEKKQYTTSQVLVKKEFYFMALSFMLVTSVFLVLNPSFKTLAIERGIDPMIGTVIVMLTGIANAFGRLSIPVLSDSIGREKVALLIITTTALCALALMSAQGFVFMVTILLIAFCYGGYTGVIPVLVADYFGIKHVGSNYGMLSVGFALSALTVPMIVSQIESVTLKFAVLTTFAVIGALLVVLLKRSKEKDDPR